jgi:hypothetical protein
MRAGVLREQCAAGRGVHARGAGGPAGPGGGGAVAVAADVGVVVHPAQAAARAAVLEGLRRQPPVAPVVVEVPRTVHQLHPPALPPAPRVSTAPRHSLAQLPAPDRRRRGRTEWLMQGWGGRGEDAATAEHARGGERSQSAVNGASARCCSDACEASTCCSLSRIIIPVLMACADSSAATVLKVQQLQQTRIGNRLGIQNLAQSRGNVYLPHLPWFFTIETQDVSPHVAFRQSISFGATPNSTNSESGFCIVALQF